MLYAPFYCEENVWHLCRDATLPAGDRHAVFISSDARATPFFGQRAAAGSDPMVWDYHVVLLLEGAAGADVYDLDTTLGFPLSAGAYLDRTFRDLALPPAYAPKFRVVAAADMTRVFSSDRSHMRGGGAWQRPPPRWTPIVDAGGSMNLFDFVDMRGSFVGEVLTLGGMRDRFAR